MEKDKRMERIEAEIVTRAKDIEDVYLIELENLKEAKKVRYISLKMCWPFGPSYAHHAHFHFSSF